MTTAVERRVRRSQGQRLLDRLAAEHFRLPGVDRAAMFGSTGLRVDEKFFAFVGADGGLVVKVPAARAAALVASGAATPVRIGRNPAREWINAAAPPPEEDSLLWPVLLSEAYQHLRSSSGTSTPAAAGTAPDGCSDARLP